MLRTLYSFSALTQPVPIMTYNAFGGTLHLTQPSTCDSRQIRLLQLHAYSSTVVNSRTTTASSEHCGSIRPHPVGT